MAEETDKIIDEREIVEEPAFGVEMERPVREGRTLRGRAVATLEVEQGPFAGMSIDTFAVPSEKPLEKPEDPARKLTGLEPAIFGGETPEDPSAAIIDPDAPPEEKTNAEHIGGALDEAVRTGDLLADVPKINYAKIVRSTPFLLCAMVAMLLVATALIRLVIVTETYVRASVKFNNYTKLNEQEQANLQQEINTRLRNLPLRKRAWTILQSKAPDLRPGFLDSGLTFHRLDSIRWMPEGVVEMRVDSIDPSADLIRLRAFSEAFYQEMDDRNQKKDEFREKLKQLEQDQVELTRQEAKLKKTIDALLPEADRYNELKQSLQAMQRYVEVADESNPLRLVAMQNLARLTQQVEEAKTLSSQRDTEITNRINVQKQIADISIEIEKMRRQIDLFPWPDPPDAKTLYVRDTRDTRTTVQRATWISIIALFGLAIIGIHWHDQRTAEAARRERREKLKAQKQQLEQTEP